MAIQMEELDKLLAAPLNAPVYYLASTQEELVAEAAGKLRRALMAQEDAGEEVSVIDGPVPNLGEVVAAAGAISFFGTRRVVELRQLSPSTLRDKDAEELAELFGQVDNAVLLVGAVYKDGKTAGSKKAKLLLNAAAKAGWAAELAKPSRRDNLAFIERAAAGLGASFEPGAAAELLDSAGENRPLLQNEAAKLAAICGYGAITKQAVARYATRNIEADVYELAGAITTGRKKAAYHKLGELLALRYEPVQISGRLAGTFVDMFRVRVGIEAKKNLSVIYKDMGYRGSEYRLQKARENGKNYSTARLQRCILCLARLDRQLKSSPLPDKSVLLQAAVGELLLLGER